ncbi:hypothetical protein [Pseudoalteromonas aliena]|uniref:hypothetical protein n=1 Tax=Pseudoalteromonas aliena TaxID=247523 RepID=UPI0024954420|nr:hypothetical protein [Pseudoalteromonas aliena]
MGDEDFVKQHLDMLDAQMADLSEIAKAQKRRTALTLEEYTQSYVNRNDAIKAAYLSGGYTLKEVGEYFKLHYSRIGKIVVKGKAT